MNNSLPDKISWKHSEHVHREKTTDWYWSVGIVATGGVFLSIFFQNYLFALIIILFVATSFALTKREPKILPFEISRKGVRAGNILYPYSLLESFWVIDEDIEDMILFRSKKPLSPIIVIPYSSDEIHPELLRDYLLDYLDEEQLEEPLYQIIMEYFGF